MPWLGIEHAARYCEVSKDYLRAHIAAGDITAYKPSDQVAARWKVHTDDLDRWVRSWECSKDGCAPQWQLEGVDG